MKDIQTESLFLDVYKTNHLSPLFDVIYQEGVRGNHILFNPDDLQKWSVLRMKLPSAEAKERASEEFRSLFLKSTYREMCDVIDDLSAESRYWFFRLYLRLIESLRLDVKSSLN